MSGAIRHILVDPGQSHRLYAAAENGGLWVLDDYREKEKGWRPLSDNLATFQINDVHDAPEARALQMRGIAKSSVNPDYIVTANAAGFVYHSKDHGRTWRKVTDQYFIEVQGHTDDTGGSKYNEDLGQRRADSVRRYLSRQHGLQLNRMSTISYGDTLPVAPNKTKAGRAQNRRVVIVVLE